MNTITITMMEYDRLKKIEEKWIKRQEEIKQTKNIKLGSDIVYSISNEQKSMTAFLESAVD